MRIFFAKLLVAVTGLLIVVLAILFAAIRNPSDDVQSGTREQVTVTTPGAGAVPTPRDATRQAAEAATIARGRAVYGEQRCRMCHSIKGEGNPRSPLDGVGGRLTEWEVRLWIVAPQEMSPTVTKRGYQLSDENLDALVSYLMASPHR
jgi:mono/diheme cytochrome c family protein